jgi:hypothetical protein
MIVCFLGFKVQSSESSKFKVYDPEIMG